ncbi:MAG: hypothetical protein ABSB76_19555 [Streptosporangiaceae bacterium]
MIRRDRISEEIGAMTDITSLLHVLEPGHAARTGPEFSEAGRGTYYLARGPRAGAGI